MQGRAEDLRPTKVLSKWLIPEAAIAEAYARGRRFAQGLVKRPLPRPERPMRLRAFGGRR